MGVGILVNHCHFSKAEYANASQSLCLLTSIHALFAAYQSFDLASQPSRHFRKCNNLDLGRIQNKCSLDQILIVTSTFTLGLGSSKGGREVLAHRASGLH